MKNKLLIIVFSVLLLGAFALAFAMPSSYTQDKSINWLSFEDGVAASAQSNKKVFIDFYTDWCGWCKRMDQTTFSDPEVIDFINKNFIAIKFNAEQKENVVYKGNTYKFVDEGRRGFHELAAFLLDKRLGYPSFAYLDENQDIILFSPGYKPKDQMLSEMKQIAAIQLSKD